MASHGPDTPRRPVPSLSREIVAAVSAFVHAVAAALALVWARGCDPTSVPRSASAPATTRAGTPASAPLPSAQRVTLRLPLRHRVFDGWWTGFDTRAFPNLDPRYPGERPNREPATVSAPAGAANLALGKRVTSGDERPVSGSLDLITDGDVDEGGRLELGRGLQWVQIDLGEPCRIAAVVIYRFRADPDPYRDVIVQLADDPHFEKDVRTVFNNDSDNSASFGVGGDWEYVEEDEVGKVIPVDDLAARYLRLYSDGTGRRSGDGTRYAEVEVYGVPAAPARTHAGSRSGILPGSAP